MSKHNKLSEEIREYFRKQGKKRSESLTAEQRRELARKAVQARWAKARTKKSSEKK
jgi:hypothetical protein